MGQIPNALWAVQAAEIGEMLDSVVGSEPMQPLGAGLGDIDESAFQK